MSLVEARGRNILTSCRQLSIYWRLQCFTGADAELKDALNDKQLTLVMAAVHALLLLNDPACYDVYYTVFTGERKNNSGMIAQELKVVRDPKQVAEMGFNEGIGYVPLVGIPWEASQTIMKDGKLRSGGEARHACLHPRLQNQIAENRPAPLPEPLDFLLPFHELSEIPEFIASLLST